VPTSFGLVLMLVLSKEGITVPFPLAIIDSTCSASW
jgi:hypothetical protein